MSDRGGFVATTDFFPAHSRSDFLNNNYGGKEAWKSAKENITDIFPGLKPLGNLMDDSFSTYANFSEKRTFLTP